MQITLGVGQEFMHSRGIDWGINEKYFDASQILEPIRSSSNVFSVR